MGPKELKALVEVDSRLENTLNYGMLSFIAKPLVYLLKYIETYAHNYGIAIILITLLIKLLLLPLTWGGEKKMKKFQENQKNSSI